MIQTKKIEKEVSSHFIDQGKNPWCSMQITLDQASTLVYYYKPSVSSDLKHDFVFLLKQDSTLYFIPIIKQGQNIEVSIEIQLLEKGTKAYIHGYYALNTIQKLFILTKQHHQATYSTSSLVLHGVLTDQASVSYTGSISIDEHAPHVIAAQSNKNMLFNDAHALSEPFLEAKNNQVQARHGSAVGKLDEEQLFYIQSRGLSLSKAQSMLIDSFKKEVFAQLPDSIVKKILKID